MSVSNPTAEVNCCYCGLPAGKADQPENPADEHPPVYCCYGCRFADALTSEQSGEHGMRGMVIRLGVAIFFTMNLMAFTMTMWSLEVYDVQQSDLQQSLFETFRWLSMLLAWPVLLLLGLPIAGNALDARRRGVLSTDLLILLAVASAYIISAVNVVRSSGPIYFEAGAMVLVMITLGRWIEAAGRAKATESLDGLLALLPKQISRQTSAAHTRIPVPAAATDSAPETTESECTFETVDSELLKVGDVLRIRSGDRIPADAVLLSGETTVDEQVFTGESRPVARSPGDALFAGTVNLDVEILAEASAGFRQGSFGRLLNALRDARASAGQYQRLADRTAAWFFPVVSVIAVAAFLLHLSGGVGQAVQTSMSVLLIACPCALGLATPLAVWTSLSSAARRQVIFRSGESIERLAEITDVCFDKTGTLTTGTPRAVLVPSSASEDPTGTHLLSAPQAAGEIEDLSVAYALASASRHPFSVAVRQLLSGLSDHEVTGDQPIEQTRVIPGCGTEAIDHDGRVMRLGSPVFCRQGSPPARSDAKFARLSGQASDTAGRSSTDDDVCFSVDGCIRLSFRVQEDMRAEAPEALKLLSASGLSLHVLSGDRPERLKLLKSRLSPEQPGIRAGLSPQQKVEEIRKLQRQGRRTAMVGDGINDAPALAAADVGVALACGTDVTRDTAEICLLGNDLTRIPWAVDHARRTTRVIRQNLFWAFGYNSAGVIAAACGLLNPAVAAALMIGSSLVVITNSLRLLGGNPQPEAPDSPSSTLRPDRPPNAQQPRPDARRNQRAVVSAAAAEFAS